MSTKQKLEAKPYIPEAWEAVVCPFCKEKKHKKWEHFGNNNQYTYVLCLHCKLVYLNPRPLYNNNFVYDAYEFYAEDDKRYPVDEEFYKHQTIFEKTEVDYVLQFDTKRTALLDVGCAVGKFLYHAKPHFNTCIGLDVSTRMANMVKRFLNIEVITEKFECWQTDQKFSCIHMSHVLEHYPFPELWLNKAKELLAPGGILIISVPHMFSLDRRVKLLIKKMGLAQNNWESWRTPDHLFEPTIPSMKRFLQAQGFRIITFHTYSRKRMSINSLTGRLYHKKLCLGSNMKFVLTLHYS